VQTFLPYPDFVVSSIVLDRQRLGKQRVETLQILKALTGLSTGWVNHPAVKMWRGHESLLTQYGVAMCDEWTGRGYQDTCRDKILELGEIALACKSQDLLQERDSQGRVPSWLGNREFHISHQSNLIRKAPEYYSKYFIGVPDDLPYVWPDGAPLPAAELNTAKVVSD
jgi:hypothetical protein